MPGSRNLGRSKRSSSAAYAQPNYTASTWTYTTTTSDFTAPTAGSPPTANVTVALSQTGWMVPGMLVYISNGGLYQVYSIASSTSAVLTNLAGYSNPTGTIASGGSVRPALVYPVTVSQPTTHVYAMTILEQISIPGNQKTLQVGGGTDGQFSVWPLPVYPNVVGNDMRVYNNVGGSHAAVNGTQNPPCIELPDGITNQGSKIWSGSGPPSALTVGAASVGDYYLCRSSAQCIAMSYATSGTGLSIGSGALTNGTALLSGSVVAGDLLVLVFATTSVTARTLTVNNGSGGTSGITPTPTDGGLTPSSSTNARLFYYSHVVQSGEISTGQVQTALSLATGTIVHAAYIFRHPNGWPTTGSLFGCPMAGTSAQTTGTGNSAITLTTTGTITLPTVSVTALINASATVIPTYTWNGSAFSQTVRPDYGLLGGGGSISGKPGLGGSFFPTGPGNDPVGNISGGSCLPTGNASCVISSQNISGNRTALLSSWSPNSTPSGTLNPIVYVCTTGGSPGTWTQVI